jgi:hypothetical protein
MIRGIGPVYAKKLVRAYGETVFDVVEQEPTRLREVTEKVTRNGYLRFGSAAQATVSLDPCDGIQTGGCWVWYGRGQRLT